MNAFQLRLKVKEAAHSSTISAKSISVIYYLLDRMDHKLRTCFPAIKTIAKHIHMSVSSVKRALSELVEHGFIQKKARYDQRKNGAQTSNLYTISTDEERETLSTRQKILALLREEEEKQKKSETKAETVETYAQNQPKSMLHRLIDWTMKPLKHARLNWGAVHRDRL